MSVSASAEKSSAPWNARRPAEHLVRGTGDLHVDEVPHETTEMARRRLHDWLKVTEAGAHEPLPDMLVNKSGGVSIAADVIGTVHRVEVPADVSVRLWLIASPG